MRRFDRQKASRALRRLSNHGRPPQIVERVTAFSIGCIVTYVLLHPGTLSARRMMSLSAPTALPQWTAPAPPAAPVVSSPQPPPKLTPLPKLTSTPPRPAGNPPYWERCELPDSINASVTIPYCRRPQSVMQAVQSVLDQTLSDVEVCVVRDEESGICDPFPAELEALAARDPRVVLMTNKGANEPTPRNIGFKRALERNFQYMASLDDDDAVVPWRFCHAITEMRKRDANLACADSYGSEANRKPGVCACRRRWAD